MKWLFFLFSFLSFSLSFSLSFQANAAWPPKFQVGDRVFDSRNYIAGKIQQILVNNSLEVLLDNGVLRIYTSYYAAELGPQFKNSEGLSCDPYFLFCVGDQFQYDLPLVGNARIGTILDIFQSSDGMTDDNRYGKIVYAIQLSDEIIVRYLNSDHLRFMVPYSTKSQILKLIKQ